MKPVFISKNFRSISTKDKWKFVGKIALYLFGAGVLATIGIFVYFIKDLPSPTAINSRVVAESTKIYDRTGEHLLYDVHGEEKRTIVDLNQIPENVKFATIALEDQDFYTHHGIKITSIIRSVFKNLQKGGVAAQGGSTITQQFVKKSLLTD
ncbi:MAG: hypothetical protein ACD_67C00109G0001, partial [uncultured bacterium]